MLVYIEVFESYYEPAKPSMNWCRYAVREDLYLHEGVPKFYRFRYSMTHTS